jgi:hypothetical protein
MGPHEYLNTFVGGRWANGACQSPIVVTGGNHNVSDTQLQFGIRVGDYIGAARDPTGNWIWGLGQYARTPISYDGVYTAAHLIQLGIHCTPEQWPSPWGYCW